MHALDSWKEWIQGRILKIVSQYDVHHSTNRPMRYNQSLERLKGALIGLGVSIRVETDQGKPRLEGFVRLTLGRQT
jgi:hypothetical protein